MQWLLLLSFCECIIMIYSFKISPKWYYFVFSRQNDTENRWRCIGQIWLGILKKYFAWKLCIMKVCYGPNISSVWKSSMWTILHGFLADWLLINISFPICFITMLFFQLERPWPQSHNKLRWLVWLLFDFIEFKQMMLFINLKNSCFKVMK